MIYLLNFSLAGKSCVGGAGKQKYGSSSCLRKEIFSGGFNCSGVVVLGY